MTVKIVADSGANLTSGRLGNYETQIVPLSLIQGSTTWTDDESFDQAAFNQAARSGIQTSSACPSITSWLTAYEDADEIYVFTISAELSGSYNSARQAAELFLEKYESQENAGRQLKIHVFDSRSAGPGEYLGMQKVAELKDQGKSFAEVVAAVNDYLQERVKLFFCLKSMTNLANNGRVAPAAAKIAGLLKICVYGWADKGLIVPLGKAQGEKKAWKNLARIIKDQGYRGGKMVINHAGNLEGAESFHDVALADFPGAKITLGDCRGLCSFYAEEGGLMIGVEI